MLVIGRDFNSPSQHAKSTYFALSVDGEHLSNSRYVWEVAAIRQSVSIFRIGSYLETIKLAQCVLSYLGCEVQGLTGTGRAAVQSRR